jgi:hypothetical protein
MDLINSSLFFFHFFYKIKNLKGVVMKAKELLVYYLEEHKNLVDEDQLYFTKEWLAKYNISQVDFFTWISKEASRFNYDINSDKAVRIFLQ